MWNSSWNEKDKNFYIRTKKITFIVLIGVAVFLVLFTLFLILGMPILRNIAAGILFVFTIAGRLFAYDINYEGAILLHISVEQQHKIDQKGIALYDKIKGTEIEAFYSWEDIDYIEYTKDTASVHSGEKMILIVKNKSEFYRAIDPKTKFADRIEKRRAKIENGCFIQCSDNELIKLKAYYDREII